MTIDEQWIGDVFRDYAGLVQIDLVYVIYQIDALTLRSSRWFDNPERLSSFLILLFMEEAEEIGELVRQNEGFGDDVEGSPTKFLLHPQNVETQLVLTSDFIAARKMIDFLMFIKPVIDIWLCTAGNPKHIPVMRFSVVEPMSLES